MEELQARGLAAEMKQLISFTVGAEEYGLELSRVKEVIRMRQVTWLPKAPASVKGVINLRGDVPIVDLRERFGLAAQKQTAMTRVIVVEVLGRMVGMVVDVANQVVRVPADQFDPPPWDAAWMRKRCGTSSSHSSRQRKREREPGLDWRTSTG